MEMEEELGYSLFDLHFARAMMRLCEPEERLPVGELLCRLLTYQMRSGHLCLDLENLVALEAWPRQEGESPSEILAERKLIQSKECRDWLESASIVTREPQDKVCPLVIQKNKLYLHRYYQYETELVESLLAFSRRGIEEKDFTRLEQQWQSYFPRENSQDSFLHTSASETVKVDGQTLAVILSLLRSFVMISGGPGTGKTTIIAKILAVRMGLNPKSRVALAATTGRAAMRIQQSLISENPALVSCCEVFTLHRLLGQSRDGLFFYHDKENPLNIDLLIIDEASMLDLNLFVRTLRALKPQAQLILLGDHCQLSPVGLGSPLSELCQFPMSFSMVTSKKINKLLGVRSMPKVKERPSPLQDSLVILNKTFRFREDSGIARLSAALRAGEVEQALAHLRDKNNQDLAYYDQKASMECMDFQKCLSQGYAHYASSLSPQEMLAASQRFCLLAPFRAGEQGVRKLNPSIARWFLNARQAPLPEGSLLRYPILILHNHYDWQLFNGDIGFVQQSRGGEARAYFPSYELSTDTLEAGSPSLQGPREFPLQLLPHSLYEMSFAMTIHKSQGSEFDHVVLVLPEEASPRLTRELIYTALTRARRKVSVFASWEVLTSALEKTMRRTSAIAERLDSLFAPN